MHEIGTNPSTPRQPLPAAAGQASEIQFHHLLEKLPAGAYICDADGLITYFNRSAVRLWGREPKLNDPVDRYCGSFKMLALDGTPIAHDQCWMAEALKTGREFNGEEVTVERPDGSRLTVLAHASPIHDDSGRVLGAVNILIDITEQFRGEEARSRLAAIVESSDDAIVSKTLDGYILSWNAGAERLFGYSPQEAVGRHITMLIPKERRDEEDAILERIRRGERIDHFETVRLTKGGRPIDISLTVSPVRDGQGRLIGASKVARDITALKQSREVQLALRDELAIQVVDLRRLHDMSERLASAPDLQSVLDETLRVAAAIDGTDLGLIWLRDPIDNALRVAAKLGLDAAALELLDGAPPDSAPRGVCLARRRRVVIEDVETDPDYAAFRATARQAGFRGVHSTPLLTRAGKQIGVLSTYFRRPHWPSDRDMRLVDLCVRQAVDFIENARLHAELREADRRKDEFLAMLAHELRNPLAPISNSLQILRMSDDLSPAVGHVREIMERQVNQLARLVDDLLEISRITSGKIELRKEPIDLVAIIATAVETSRPLIDAAGHQLAIALSQEPLVLEADPVRLSQVVSNLLNNAAKYTDRGGQIWLAAERRGNEAVVSVRDTGEGITADMLPRIFDLFSQVDRTLSRAQGGLGVGLTLARRLVELHGGQIEAHSEGQGKGSEFVLRLPLAETAPRLALPTAPRTDRASQPSRRILVVDDQQAAAHVLGKLLEITGHRVRTAHDAATALQCAAEELPDVVISDIEMPDMNGYELARRLRELSGAGDLVLVALTGYGQSTDRQRAAAAGFHHHLVKPVGFEMLQDLLASLPAPAERGKTAASSTAGELPPEWPSDLG